MVFSKDYLSLIKILRQEKHYGANTLLKEFPNRNWSIAALKLMLPDQQKNGMLVVDHAQLVLWKMLILLNYSY